MVILDSITDSITSIKPVILLKNALNKIVFMK